MSGEHRYRSAPASPEYRSGWDAIFGKQEPAYVWTGHRWVDRRVAEKEKDKVHERQA